MKWKAADRMGEVKEYYFSRKLKEINALRKTGVDVINLGIGNPDLPPHPSVISALQTQCEMTNSHGYQSYKGSLELRTAISRWYKRKYLVNMDAEHEILPLAGSKEGIMHIHMALINPGDEVLIPDPGYPAYGSCAKLAGANVVSYDLKSKDGFQPDIEQIRHLINHKTRMIWINFPNMPTGTPLSEGFADELISLAMEHHLIICHDNPYSFILNDNPPQYFPI